MYRCIAILLVVVLFSCNSKDDVTSTKGFQVSEITEDEEGNKKVGLKLDSLDFQTRPREVLLTSDSVHRLIPIYKVNMNKKTGETYTGFSSYHTSWNDNEDPLNNWNNNFMPGLEAMQGYNLVNVSYHNIIKKDSRMFFKKSVLIKTLYYPTFSKDTLNGNPVKRDYYLVSAYDEDTNSDGYINAKDLRRLYLFDVLGNLKSNLVPKNYYVMSSKYDQANDYMYVYARKDKNKNGQMESDEAIDIFWIDLKQPSNNGYFFKN